MHASPTAKRNDGQGHAKCVRIEPIEPNVIGSTDGCRPHVDCV